MKTTTLYYLFFFLISQKLVNAQCLQDADFESFCGTARTATCGGKTFDPTCLPGWHRSHGTPEIFVPGPQAINNYCQMWFGNLNGLIGEGIFADFSFKKHNAYSIHFRANAYNPNVTGQYFLYAANNIPDGTLTNSCGDALPTVNSKELIHQYGNNSDWTEYTISYIPTADYAQLWIYPYTTSSTQFNLNLDFITVCPDCDATIIYNANGQIPIGETKAGYIYAGSSAGTGGSGTVNIFADQLTTLTAVNEIRLLPEFDASVAFSGEFDARIESCAGANTRRGGLQNRRGPATLPNEDKISSIAPNRFLIYPNPSVDKVNIEFNFLTSTRINIQLLNSIGLVVKEISSLSSETGTRHFTLDMANLPNGAYFIEMIDDKGNVYVKKIQKLN
jgi:hypothetical protein